ncbi:MAG: hypothetical protein KGH59_04950 [Candidatus Micrarchaeota archaeon]|nr:hypothetical protein [Candidatus Micrarchaeota archaeon]
MASVTTMRMSIRPEDYLNDVYTTSGLSKLVRNSDAIIALKDMQGMWGERTQSKTKVTQLSDNSVVGIVRSVRDKNRHEVYMKSKISIGKFTPGSMMSSQTFAELRKIAKIVSLYNTFREFDFSGSLGGTAFAVSTVYNDMRYLSFYLPPITEEIDKAGISVPLVKLARRASKERYAHIPAMDGNGKIDIREIVRSTKAMFDDPKVQMLQVLRDGAHRAMLAHTSGAKINMIRIEKPEASPKSVPIFFSQVITASRKPEKKEDRFLGFTKSAWLDFESVGIDG